MQNKTKIMSSLVITLALLFSISLLTVPTDARAGAKPEPIEGMSYNINSSIADNLKALQGKKVYVTLDSGTNFIGKVKAIGPHLLHLEKLDGKTFFDALIRIEKISAIHAMFRKYK